MSKAASEQGRIAAGVDIGELPDHCRQHMQRVMPQVGDKARWSQKAWEINADAIDDQIDFCAAFDDDRRSRLMQSDAR
ncbi:hypothetical protein ACXHXG_30365 [Rhizobium sp. LEGMi198b]